MTGSPRRAVVRTLVIVVALTLIGVPVALTALAPATVAADGGPNAAPAPIPISLPLGCTSGNVVSFAHPLVVRADQWICGDVDVYGGGVRVLGHVGGSVTAVDGDIRVMGEVDGSVTAVGGSVALMPGSRVAGNVQALGGHVSTARAAEVFGTVETGDGLTRVPGARWLGLSGPWHFSWLWIGVWVALAAIIITLFPERTARVRMVARRATMRSLVVGLLTAVLGMGLITVLFATCIGIPISLLILAALLAGWVLGTVGVGLWLGERLVRTLAPRQRSPLLPAVLGMALLAAGASIPCIGGAIAILASSLGLGAALLSRFGARRSGLALPAPAPPLA